MIWRRVPWVPEALTSGTQGRRREGVVAHLPSTQPHTFRIFHSSFHDPCMHTLGAPGSGVLTIMAYTGRLRPKEVPFSGFRYMKG